tara:strand:+ start:349 stop:489 length:141 start_codon:yes stop_codon:yes gene_type:complete
MDSDNKGLGQHSAAFTGKRVSVGVDGADQFYNMTMPEAESGALVGQ